MNTSVLARMGTACFGCALVMWAALNVPGFWRAADAGQLAAQIVQGRSFQADVVGRAEADARAFGSVGSCRPAADRAVAILRLYLYEDVIAAKRLDQAPALLESLRDGLRSALYCVPSDGYLWLLQFSQENARGGAASGDLDDLLMSYRMAPHEGWVAVKRSAVALKSFPALTPELQRLALDEFADLVQNKLYDEAAAIYADAILEVRIRLQARLIAVPLADRERFAKALQSVLPGAQVLGVDRSDDQPWKH